MNIYLTQALSMALDFPPLRACFEAPGEILESLPQIAHALETYRCAWVQHPQYAYLKAMPELAWKDWDNPLYAEVMLSFKHAPGVEGREYSYVVTDVRELNLAYAWATRTRIGDFDGLLPIRPNISIDPFNITFHSYTHAGRAKGFHCRDQLKRYLPAKLRKWVNKLRRAKRVPKYRYLEEPLPCNNFTPMLKGGSDGAIKDSLKAMPALPALPEWYTSRTKADLWAEKFRISEPVVAAQIDYWIALPDFYRVVSGEVDPNTVRSLFKRIPAKVLDQPVQLTLF